MTLQYRIRSKHEDDKWLQRIFLTQELLLHCSEQWCKGTHSTFPIAEFILRLLLLFSPRCLIHQTKLQSLTQIHTSANEEYRATWPNRSETNAFRLIDLLTGTLKNIVSEWESNGFPNKPHDIAVGELVDVMVREQFVVFHHNQTTSRDLNHWGI